MASTAPATSSVFSQLLLALFFAYAEWMKLGQTPEALAAAWALAVRRR